MKKVLALILVLLLLAACGREDGDGSADRPDALPEATRTAVASTAEEVSFPTSRDLTLRGTLYGSGTHAVIFVHEPNGDRSNWDPLALELAARGYMTLVYDLRGNGESDGHQMLSLVRDDIDAAIDFIEERGAEAYILVGSDYGGMEAIHVAAEREPAAVVLISVPDGVAYAVLQRSLRDSDIQGIDAPKLLIVAEDDKIVVTDDSSGITYEGPDYHRSMRDIRDRMSEPVELVVLDGSEHGHSLLESEQADELKEAVFEFLETHTPPGQ